MKSFNSYNDALKFITDKKSLGIMPGLDRIINLLNSYSNPQNDFKIIHVAGTNGKGTVAATIAKALEKNGFKTGLFTSPCVTDYREQIQINGEFISEAEFIKLAELVKSSALPCTEFEAVTFMAYKYFSDMKADYAVIECGMGGKGDSTNVEKENLSVITSISLDHTDFFGSSLSDIAEEKAGILRKNSDCIIYSDSLKDIFEPKCKNLIISPENTNLSLVNTVLNYLNIEPVSELVRLPARQELLNGVLFDGGHNVAAAKALAPLLDNENAVIAMLKDKDVEGYLSLVAPKCKKITVTQSNNARSMPAKELAKIAKKYCNEVCVIENPLEAVKQDGISLVCGSFYLMREVRKYFL